MPPKSRKDNWAWVSTVESASDITDDHRLQAAGLTDLVPCTYPFSVDDDVTPVKDKQCGKGRCKTNPACLSHLGAETLSNEKGKEEYLERKLPVLDSRGEGPAGLRNLGATCYVSPCHLLSCGRRALG